MASHVNDTTDPQDEKDSRSDAEELGRVIYPGRRPMLVYVTSVKHMELMDALDKIKSEESLNLIINFINRLPS